ncbi:MAG TPA: sensor histidine kinase [Chthonomonadales bacterium]|nr:sensor histidine kinase [Chthonomonadales bacterium]
MEAGQRARQLVFLIHVWVCTPFVILFLWSPAMHAGYPAGEIAAQTVLSIVGATYLLVRTVLVLRGSPLLRYAWAFPLIDLGLISVALHQRQSTDTVLYYAYFLPIAEAAGTLSFAWAGTVAALAIVGAVLATLGEPVTHPLGTAFRLFFFAVMASLITFMARFAADLRVRLRVEADRSRLAMEMHDGVQAHLVGVAAQLELASRLASHDLRESARVAGDARELTRAAADELRFVVQRLRAPRAEEGFLAALRQHLHHVGGRSGLNASVVVRGRERALDAEVEHALFRIVQESITNALKHAGASSLRVDLAYGERSMRCSIGDDGRGFDTTLPRPEGHMGIANMRSRADAVGGSLTVRSAPGAGTTVVFEAPLAPRRPSYV